MQAEILIVPTSATLDMLKASAQQLAQTFVQSGITVYQEISICPDRKRLQHAVSNALNRSEIVVTLGGMGRESRFLTKQVLSEGLGLPLQHSQETLTAIREFYSRTGIAGGPDDVTLASLPAGCHPLIPYYGIIPGCIIASPKQYIVMLPENQQEIMPMVTRQVMPILSRSGLSVTSTHEINTYGATEEQVQHLILDLMGTTNPVVTTRKQGNQVIVKVVATGANSDQATSLSSPVLRIIASRLGDYAYGLDVSSMQQALAQKLYRKGITVSIAENGTAGLGARMLSQENRDVVGLAVQADGRNEMVHRLGMVNKHIKRRGEISEYVAVAMADSVRRKGESPLGAGVTATTTDEKGNPTAYIAVCDNKNVYVKKIVIDEPGNGDKTAMTHAITERLFNMIRLVVDYYPEPIAGSVALDRVLSGRVTVTDKDSYQSGMEYNVLEEEKPKKDKKGRGDKVRKFILIIAILVFLGGAGRLALYQYQSVRAGELRDNLTEVYDQTGITGLRSLNADTVAFISMEGTEMRYPVVQAVDNDYYLRRDFNGNNHNHGIPFMDYRCDPKKPSDNLIIYGHNMRDGQIFGELLKYKDVEFYKENPIIELDTVKKNGEYKVFAIFITSAEPSHFSDGQVFEYHNFINSPSAEEFNQFITQVKYRSLLNLPVDVQPGDELLTLSTCDYDFSDSRFVVMARRVRTGESSNVEVELAQKNQTPLYPDVWYNTYGGTKPNVDASGYSVPETAKINPFNLGFNQNIQLSTMSATISPEKLLDIQMIRGEGLERMVELELAALEKDEQTLEDKAEAEKQAEDKAEKEKAEQAEKEAKAKEEAEKKEQAKKAEELTLTYLSQVKTETKSAEKHLDSANGATSKTDVTKYATASRASANKAASITTTARTSAQTAGTQTAVDAFNEALSLSKDAKAFATQAETIAKEYEEEYYNNDSTSLKIRSAASYDPDDNLEIISRIVQQEVGSSFHTEAIKAQAVATYTFILEANSKGQTPTMPMASKADSKVTSAVSAVLGEAVYYNGRYAFTPYHATSAGSTTTSGSVWGGSYPYLVSVDSYVDESARGYKYTTTMSASEVEDRLYSRLGIDVSGDPSSWFEILSHEDGGYNGRMSVCGETKSKKTGSVLTGRLIRETVLNIRSACFEVDYSSSRDSFSFTTYGYGHGVGMSQTGANGYANKGWSYKDILQHYYSGTTVK